MGRFAVRAIGAGGVLSTVVLDAGTPEEAAASVRKQGLSVVRVGGEATFRGLRLGRGSHFSLGQFSQEMLTLLEAGLPVVEAVETLKEKESAAERQLVLARIVDGLFEGLSLSQALEQQGSVFPPLYIATIRASEKSGDLPEALRRFVAYQLQLDVVRKKIVSAAIYPALLVGAGTLVVIFLLAWVVPRFAKIFEELGNNVPFMSRVLMQWGNIVQEHGPLLLLGLLAIVLPLGYWLTRPATRSWLLTRLSEHSTMGEMLSIYQLARFYRTLGMLLRSGMPIMTALAMTHDLLQPGLRSRLSLATEKVRQGLPMSQAMESCQLTTPVSLRMLRVGERTGQMGEMMERIAIFYDDEIARWVDWFIRLFEPLLMVVIGVVIGGIVVLMYFPIFELAGSLQ